MQCNLYVATLSLISNENILNKLPHQQEALNRDRRDHLTTTEFKEKKQGHVPVRYLEADRLVNRTGTKESQISLGEKKKLTAWNGESPPLLFIHDNHILTLGRSRMG